VRMHTSFIRVGGLLADVPEEFYALVNEVVRTFPAFIDQYELLITKNPIWMERTRGLGVLTPDARATYERFSRAWEQTTGEAPTEEGLAGFSAAWALFHDVMPRAAGSSAASIASAARALDLPLGSLPNGAGVRFSTDRAMLGQNTRAAAVIWQWQAVRHSVTVWPPVDATGTPQLIPLPA